jgi:indole-3-glycerol phosphate synthase
VEHPGPHPPSFRDALTAGPTVTLIAEFKRRSPSAGPIAGDEVPAEVARAYAAGGARALSTLTDREDFDGTLSDLTAMASVTGLPTLRKDFIVDERALVEGRLAGASAALLIVRMLTDAELRKLVSVARLLGLDALVEVHDERELERALLAEATIIGVNNRNLDTLVTDLRVTERLAPRVPRDAIVVSESGIRTAADVTRVRDAGAKAVLVGEALLQVHGLKRAALVAELAGVGR